MAASIPFMVTLHGLLRLGGDQQFVMLARSAYKATVALVSNPGQPVDWLRGTLAVADLLTSCLGQKYYKM